MPAKMSSLKSLGSGSDSGLQFGSSKMCSEGFSLQSQSGFHICDMSQNYSKLGFKMDASGSFQDHLVQCFLCFRPDAEKCVASGSK